MQRHVTATLFEGFLVPHPRVHAAIIIRGLPTQHIGISLVFAQLRRNCFRKTH
jgi:hypothetical protein